MKKIIISTIGCFALLQAAANLEPGSPEDLEWRALSTNLRHVSLAYRSVAIQRMLAEANYCSAQLHLSGPHPIQPADFQEIRVFSLWYSRLDSTNAHLSKINRVRAAQIPPAGIIRTTNMFFSFRKGILAYVCRESEDGYEYHPHPGGRVIINDAEAYQLATQNLAAISVDLVALEKQLKPKVWRYHYGQIANNNEEVASFFIVQWGEGDTPPIKVTIDGTTKGLLAIDMLDTSFSRRPLLIITNAVELNNIPDPPMKHLERPSVSQTNSANSTFTNTSSARPPPGGQEMKQE